MVNLPDSTLSTLRYLELEGVDPILYGSQGVSLYIGPFKQFGDLDLLVNHKWVDEDWRLLITKMERLGFSLNDEHEHEFVNQDGAVVAFANSSILVSDKVTDSVINAIQMHDVDGTQVRTLKPDIFLKAYEFSVQDGYRKTVRNKKDSVVIKLLSDYLKST